jgi:hypothetical protein
MCQSRNIRISCNLPRFSTLAPAAEFSDNGACGDIMAIGGEIFANGRQFEQRLREVHCGE